MDKGKNKEKEIFFSFNEFIFLYKKQPPILLLHYDNLLTHEKGTANYLPLVFIAIHYLSKHISSVLNSSFNPYVYLLQFQFMF